MLMERGGAHAGLVGQPLDRDRNGVVAAQDLHRAGDALHAALRPAELADHVAMPTRQQPVMHFAQVLRRLASPEARSTGRLLVFPVDE
jgi:hypothetical protein